MKFTCECYGDITRSECLEDSLIVPCLKCSKCGKIYYTPEQAMYLIRLRKANEAIESQRKIVKVGSSIAAILPKKLEKFGLAEGDTGTIKVLSPNSIQLSFKKKLFYLKP
ncbi:hypothetical protein J4475_00190 [Candidatus Woesearchaeota archaeon]|nr:hypothetical protein [Candidatus Woesearchaeota archaeon]